MRTKASGSAIERSTWVSAAKLTTASTAVHRLGRRARVLDRAVDELVLDVLEVLAPARVGQLVEDDDLVAVVAHAHAHEVRADEAGTAADQQPHRATTALSLR